MKAWSMFVHSLRLVINNIDVALRVSLVLYSVQVASQVFAYAVDDGSVVDGPTGLPGADISAGEGFVMFLLGLAALLASLWIAVAWHRYVLLGEVPAGWLPKWPGAAIPGYLWRSVLLGLSVALVAVPVGAVGALILPPVLMLALTVGVASFVFFRLSPILPAIALGTSLSFGEAWQATRGEAGTIAGLAGLMILGSLALQVPTMLSGDPNSLLSLVYSVVVGWFATMIGISLLTTVYGTCVEGRGID
ncbi:hypothetical protein [Marinovum sp.]|uniref:hypothetical protein n=1 Tax=Marinovum sp. TaxID=2024839 RepID=UPI002B26914B|nr:hypothetical protein [Marinovum sp.]